MGRKIFFWILLIIYSVVIFIFSSQPEVGVEQYFYGQDKVIHFLTYGIYAFLCLAALSDKILLLKLFHYFLALAFSVSYGMFNEIYQYFIPEREFSLGDVLANSLGVITFLILIYIFQIKKKNRHIEEIEKLSFLKVKELHKLIIISLKILRNLYNPHGFNIGYNLGKGSGASIKHLHLHIVPRYENELSFIDVLSGSKIIVEEPKDTVQKLKREYKKYAEELLAQQNK